MTVNNNNPLDLTAKAGETITIQIVEQNTVKNVGVSLNGSTLTESSFAVPSNPDPTLLTISLGFGGNTGKGRYAVTLTGSPGGDPSFFIAREPSDRKINSHSYTIDVTQ